MAPPQTELTRRAPLARARLLLVEDDLDMRAWLAELLTAAGAEVKEAGTGVDALWLLAHEGPFDLAIADVRMPAPSGVQLAAMARTAGYAGPFLIITAFPSDQVRERVGGIERAALLAKPFCAEEFLQLAGRMMSAAAPADSDRVE